MGGQFMSLYASRASRIQRRLSPYLPTSIRRYSEGSKTEIQKNEQNGNLIDEERARSTAEEFRRVAEEKTRRGVAGQNVQEKAESVSKTETVKEAYKEPPGDVNAG